MIAHIKCPNPSCSRQYRVAKDAVNRAVQCRHCGTRFTVEQVLSAPPASLDALPAKVGRFEVRTLLGEGAFGRVFRAHDPQLDREVALKVPHPATLANPRAVERFLREACAASRLRHPHLVPIYDAGRDGQHLYIAAAFIEGRTLEQAIDEGQLDERDAARIVRELAEALDYAHGQGIVHRDVKPANVLLDAQGQAHLADFGLAHRQESAEKLTHDGALIGTPAYMPPEQARGRQGEVLPASDQYSLGVVLYELLAGRVPFSGPVALVLSMHANQDPPAPRSIRPSVSRDLETICLKAMAKEPERRYVSCAALAADLRRWLEGEPIRARRMGVGEQMVRWCRRNPLMAGACGVAAAALLLTFVLAVSFAVSQNSHAREVAAERDKVKKEGDKVKKERDKVEERSEQLKEANAQLLAKQAEKDAAMRRAGEQAKRAEEAAAEARKAKEHADQNAEQARKNEALVQSQKERAEGQSYVARIILAQREWRDGDVPAAWQHWNTCKKELCGWEHRYLHALFTGRQRTVRLPSSRGLCFSPDGKRFTHVAEEGTVTVWDVDQEEALATLKGHAGGTTCLCFSADGKQIASGGNDNIVRIWDAERGQELHALKGHDNPVSCVCFSPVGNRLASVDWVRKTAEGGDATLKIWNFQQEKEQFSRQGFTPSPPKVSFNANGAWLASDEGGGIVRIWDLTREKQEKQYAVLKGELGEIRHVHLSSKSAITRIAFAARGLKQGKKVKDVETVRICTVDSQNNVATLLLGQRGEVQSLCFGPGGRLLAVAAKDRSLTFWDTRWGNHQYQRPNLEFPRAHAGDIRALCFSPDGERLASGDKDGKIKVWSIYEGRELLTLQGHLSELRKLRFTSDASRLVSADASGIVKVWNLKQHADSLSLQGHKSEILCACFSPDGKRLLTAGTNEPMRLWDCESGKQILASQGAATGEVRCLSFRPDGKQFASAGDRVSVWNAERAHWLITLKGDHCVSYGPDGQRLASGARGAVKIWDAANAGRELLTLPTPEDTIASLAFRPDGQRLAAACGRDGAEATIRIWDAEQGRELLVWKGHPQGVRCLCFSPDGKRLASAGEDATVRVWDADSGQEIFTLRGHTSGVRGVCFSPDGKRLASAGEDKTVKIWHAEWGQELLTLKGHTSSVNGVCFSPDGQRLASVSDDRTIKIWQAAADER